VTATAPAITTTLRALLGLIRPTAGTATIEGGTEVGQVAGGLLLLGYAALFAFAGAILLRRRDISA
jgi:hypothetical protein